VAFFPRRVKMLILIRKIGEFITIGDKIKIYVVDIQGKQIRLGIEPPPMRWCIGRRFTTGSWRKTDWLSRWLWPTSIRGSRKKGRPF
jgi:hypothetical protein